MYKVKYNDRTSHVSNYCYITIWWIVIWCWARPVSDR